MSIVKSIIDLQKSYDEISEICHQSGEPVFITKNGYGDLVVMSRETYERQMPEPSEYRQIRLEE